jgi:hypothetical protein
MEARGSIFLNEHQASCFDTSLVTVRCIVSYYESFMVVEARIDACLSKLEARFFNKLRTSYNDTSLVTE